MDETADIHRRPFPGNERRSAGRRVADRRPASARTACLAAALEHLPHRTLLLVPGVPLRVWYANAAARMPLEVPVVQLRDDVLEVREDSARQALYHAVRQVVAAGPGHPMTLALQADERMHAAVDVRLDALDVDSEAGVPVSRLVMMQLDEVPSHDVALQRLCADYGLTHMEAETALLLHARGSTDELVRSSGKSVHTVRSQIKAAMQKTETHSQAALVALVGRCLAMRA